MPLPPPRTQRFRQHQRTITFDGYERSDGLWDIEGRLLDRKDEEFRIKEMRWAPGESLHDIRVRLTIDGAMNVIDIEASLDATPFAGACENILPDYRKVVGLNLMHGFLRSVKEMFAGTCGCTHLSELLMSMPTAAFQTLSGERKKTETDRIPHHLDRCHALDLKKQVVQRYYPRWFRGHDHG